MTIFKNKKFYIIICLLLIICGSASFYLYKKVSIKNIINNENVLISKYSREKFVKTLLKNKNLYNKNQFEKYILNNFDYFLKDNNGLAYSIENFVAVYEKANSTLANLRKMKTIGGKDYLILTSNLNKLKFDEILSKTKYINLKKTSNDVVAEKAYFVGLIYQLSFRNNEAENQFLSAIKLNNFGAKYYNSLGEIYYSNYKFVDAVNFYEKGLNKINYKNKKDLKVKYELLFNLAKTYETINNNQKALNIYNYIALLSKDKNDLRNEYLATFNIASLKYSTGNYVDALDYLKYSLKLAFKLNDKNLSSQSMNLLSRVSYKYGDYTDGKKYGFKALKIAKRKSNFSLMSSAMLNISLNYEYLNKYELAKSYCERAVRINKILGNILNRPEYYLRNGDIYSSVGTLRNYEKSKIDYETALSISKQYNLKLLEISALYGLSEDENMLGNKKLAIDYLNKAIEEKNVLNVKKNICDACLYGFIYWQDRNYNKAIKDYEDGLAKALANDNKLVVSSIASHLASINYELKHYKKALKYSSIALEMDKKIYRYDHHYIKYQEEWQKRIMEEIMNIEKGKENGKIRKNK